MMTAVVITPVEAAAVFSDGKARLWITETKAMKNARQTYENTGFRI